MQVSRCAKFRGVRIRTSFMKSDALHGACLVRVGRGSLYYQGIMPLDFNVKDGTPNTDRSLAILLYVFLISEW
jgi:hypothetical protein